MKFLKRTVLITALLGIFLFQTSCGDNKTVNTGESGAGQTGTTTTTATTAATVATTSTASTTTTNDSWLVSQKIERIERTGGTTEDSEYLLTVTVRKDRPSDIVGWCREYTNVDGDWAVPCTAVTARGSSGQVAVQENPDGTVTS